MADSRRDLPASVNANLLSEIRSLPRDRVEELLLDALRAQLNECIHLPRTSDEHDRLHTKPKPSCGWCAWLKAEAANEKLVALIRDYIGDAKRASEILDELLR